jgi:hypothetical protein
MFVTLGDSKLLALQISTKHNMFNLNVSFWGIEWNIQGNFVWVHVLAKARIGMVI